MNETHQIPPVTPPGVVGTDPAQPGYYARRAVTSETEQRMRADAVRAERLREQAINAEVDEQFFDLIRQAESLERRWAQHRSAAVQADWAYLFDARHDWRHAPESMGRLYEQVILDRVDGFTEGMSSTEWRSQRQAREMAGYGQWQPAHEVSYHPVDPRSPEHWADYATSRTEQQMRGDYAAVHLMDIERGRTYTDHGYLQITEWMHTISEPWLARDDEYRNAWRDLRGLGNRYLEACTEEEMDRLGEQYRSIAGEVGDPVFSRSVEQARRLGRCQLASEMSVDASNSPKPIASSAFAAARTAELAQNDGRAPIPGHAFAGLVDGREQEGLER